MLMPPPMKDINNYWVPEFEAGANACIQATSNGAFKERTGRRDNCTAERHEGELTHIIEEWKWEKLFKDDRGFYSTRE